MQTQKHRCATYIFMYPYRTPWKSAGPCLPGATRLRSIWFKATCPTTIVRFQATYLTTTCHFTIPQSLSAFRLQISYLTASSNLFVGCFRPHGSTFLPSPGCIPWILVPASWIIEFNEIPMVFQYPHIS